MEKLINTNLGECVCVCGGEEYFYPPPTLMLFFFLNDSKTVKAVTLAFCNIQ